MVWMTIINNNINKTLNLKQFLLRSEVLGLYRRILRYARKHPNDADRQSICQYARSEFERNRHYTEVNRIRALMAHGVKQLRDLEITTNLSMSDV